LNAVEEIVDIGVVIRNPDLLGEAPVYDAAGQRVLWTDTIKGVVHERRLADDGATWEGGRSWEIGPRTTTGLPRAIGGLVVTSMKEVILLTDGGDRERLTSLDVDDAAGVRFSDAKCDPQGRLVAGWIDDDGVGRAGGLVRVDAAGTVEPLLDDVAFANGLDWSSDGETFYFADTTARTVDAFDYDASGALSNRRNLVTLEPGKGVPDGLAVDVDDNVWLAVPYAGEVQCYSPLGELLESVRVPSPLPTSCAFAGPNGDMLVITSVSFEIPRAHAEQLGISPDRIAAANDNPLGGALFVCRPGANGPPAHPFLG
jgi:sugar lactone lactonase YvrE